MNLKRAFDDMRTIKQLLTEAERIARDLGRAEPDAEHLLLSALALPDGTAARAMAGLGVDAAAIREALRADEADALVAAGIPRSSAEAMTEPEPLGSAGTPPLYAAAPSAREVFQHAGTLARDAKQHLVGAHVVLAVARLERGTLARTLARLGIDRDRLADAARAELTPG